jgi:hypothetical protein
MHVHSTLALREDGVPIGLLGQSIWCREPGKKNDKKEQKKKPIEEKESSKWLGGILSAREALAENLARQQRPRLIHVGDRECDIHEVFEAIRDSEDGAVIRSAQNRRIVDTQGGRHYARPFVRASPLMGTRTIDVPRKHSQPSRQATVQIRACQVRLCPSSPQFPKRRPVDLALVEVWEENPPDDLAGLHWLLWTTEPVGNAREALRVVSIYKKRWKIEEFHLVLKSGCRIEDVRFETAARIAKAVSLYSPAAVRIIQLRDFSRIEPDAPSTLVLREEQWRTLWTHIHRKPPTPCTPPPTIRQAARWIGRLGGHLGRKRDGMPGVRTLWRGWRDLDMMTSIYRTLRC